MKSSKAIKVKPAFYAKCYEELKKIAEVKGYNLLIHGSMNRDMDLVAVPWINTPTSHLEVLRAFCEYLGVPVLNDVAHYMYSVLPGGRHSYVINLNRGGDKEDPQWYLDISFTPLVVS